MNYSAKNPKCVDRKIKKMEKNMKKMLVSLVCFAILAMAYSFIGTSSVSAAPASPEKGTLCYVSGDGLNYYEDESCSAHSVFKFDNEGNFQFWEYQDHGQLPEEARPSQPYRNTFEQCFDFSFGEVCGTVQETATPSGEYKSSFHSY
jgi:hypothetical protein